MKIDATRYKLFWRNPEEYRLKELHNLVPVGGGGTSGYSFGRRRGTAFHSLCDGVEAADLEHLGGTAVATAQLMHEANEEYGKDTEVLWTEREFCLPLPGCEHEIVGRVDAMCRRYDETFILDHKTSKHRTKEGFVDYLDELSQNPQADFYLLAHPEVRKFVYRVLNKKPATNTRPAEIQIRELEIRRQTWELKAFARGVMMTCDLICFLKDSYGIEKPWPRALKVFGPRDMYAYDSIYQRDIYPGMADCLEGFEPRREHLKSLGTTDGV